MANIAEQEIFINYISELKKILVGRNNQPISQLIKIYYNCQTDYYFQIVNKNNQIVSLAGREFKIYGTYTDAKKQTHILFFTNSYNIEDNTLHFHINTNTEDYKSYVNDPEGKVAYVTIIQTTANGVSVVLNDKGLFYPRTGLENDTPIDVVYETILTGVTVPLTGSFAAGENINLLPGADSFAFGTGLITQSENQLVVGSYNVPDGQQVFIVGNGTSDSNRNNIFTVNVLGEAYLSGARVLTQYDRINVSQLVNDVGYITIADVPEYSAGTGLALDDETLTFSLTASIPSAVSDLANDLGFITSGQVDKKIATATNDMATQTWVEDKHYITSYVDTTYSAGTGISISEDNVISVTNEGAAATQEYVDNAISGLSATISTDYATTAWVEDKNYITLADVPEGTVYGAGEGLALDNTTHTFYLTAAIPTGTAQLDNDADFISGVQLIIGSHDETTTTFEFDSGDFRWDTGAIFLASNVARKADIVTYTGASGIAVDDINNIISISGQVGKTYTAGSGIAISNENEISLTASIPSSTSELTNDSNFISDIFVDGMDQDGFSVDVSTTTIAFNGDYFIIGDLNGNPQVTINEANFINLGDVNGAISNASGAIVSGLATTGWVTGWVEEHSTSPLSGGTNIEIANDVVNCTLSAVSDLTNDVGYLVEGDLSAVSEFANDIGYLTESDLSNKQVLSTSNSDQITYDSAIDIFNTFYIVSNDAITLNTVTVPAGSLGVGEVATFEEWIYTDNSFTTVDAGSNVFIGEVPSSFAAATNHVFVRRLVNNGGTITQYVSFAYEVPTT